ncbi:MAG: class I SAM-dependent methyltransferase [Lentisphaeraceae bacterium]|nr:class I SAM-dependent methyltransferase [Lentisphaeraceae bacterium]
MNAGTDQLLVDPENCSVEEKSSSSQSPKESRQELSSLRKAVLENPEELALRVKYAVACFKADKHSKCVDILNQALDINGFYEPALDLLGKFMLYWGGQCGATGWFTALEAGQLYRSVRSINNDAPVIVELGSCFGLSSMIIARALEEKQEAKIYCVDAWEGDGSSVFEATRDFVKRRADEGEGFFDIFKKNMLKSGFFDRITPVQGYTTDVVKNWQEEADIIFVDADHSYEGVRKDVRDWKDFVKVGGHLLMHDVDLVEAGSEKDSGPGLVVKEFLTQGSNYAPGYLVDTLYRAKRIN